MAFFSTTSYTFCALACLKIFISCTFFFFFFNSSCSVLGFIRLTGFRLDFHHFLHQLCNCKTPPSFFFLELFGLEYQILHFLLRFCLPVWCHIRFRECYCGSSGSLLLSILSVPAVLVFYLFSLIALSTNCDDWLFLSVQYDAI